MIRRKGCLLLFLGVPTEIGQSELLEGGRLQDIIHGRGKGPGHPSREPRVVGGGDLESPGCSF